MTENGDPAQGHDPIVRQSGSCPEPTSAARRLPGFLFRAVEFDGSRLRILDQTLLPHRTKYLYPRSAAEVADIIKRLAVRGAPAIGVAAAYGLAVEAKRLPDTKLRDGLAAAARMLVGSRPTAVNLNWAVVRVMRSVSAEGLPRLSSAENRGCTQLPLSPASLRQGVLNEAQRIESEDIARSFAMAMGTALGVVFQAHLDGRKPSVYACETRPLLQGARLTTFELLRAKIPVTLIADSAAASVLDKCDVVLVGADRIAANGDTANKIGTRMLATLARAARRPFYVVAPTSTFDLATPNGGQIVVEERDGEEVRSFTGCRAAPVGVPVFNPAFDVTSARLITGFITDRGILSPPYRRAIRQLLAH
jgi:methylthioribose-1-phosphate isomerase